MSHIPWRYLAPDLTWDQHSALGPWLEHFIFFLASLPSKRESNMQQELAAFLALLDAAEPFIDEDYDAYDPDSELKPQLIQIAQADEWGRTSQFSTLPEFEDYVNNGRHSTMTYEDAVACLHDNHNILFGPSPTPKPELFALVDDLKELKRLRDAAEALVQCLDLSPFVWTDGQTGEKLKFDPRQRYQEFKDHYAYEKTLCIPLY